MHAMASTSTWRDLGVLVMVDHGPWGCRRGLGWMCLVGKPPFGGSEVGCSAVWSSAARNWMVLGVSFASLSCLQCSLV